MISDNVVYLRFQMEMKVMPSVRKLLVFGISLFMSCLVYPQTQSESSGYAIVLDGTNDPNSISLAEASMAFYRIVTGLEQSRSGAGIAHLRSRMELSESASQAYMAYMQSAVVDDNQFQLAERRRLCARRDQITSEDQLIDALELGKKNLALKREQIARDSETVLSADEKLVADDYILSFRNGTIISTTDYAKSVSNSGKTLSFQIDELCKSHTE
jgi:hypothetical protein